MFYPQPSVRPAPPFAGAQRFVRPEKYLPALTSAYQAYALQAARDGLEFASTLSGKSDKPRPMASWKTRPRPAQSDVPCIPDRAAGVLEEAVKAVEMIPPKRRAGVSKRRVSTFRIRRWFLSAGSELCSKLVDSLRCPNRSVENGFNGPASGRGVSTCRAKVYVYARRVAICASPEKKRGLGRRVAGRGKSTWHRSSVAPRSWRTGQQRVQVVASRNAQLGRGPSPPREASARAFYRPPRSAGAPCRGQVRGPVAWQKDVQPS